MMTLPLIFLTIIAVWATDPVENSASQDSIRDEPITPEYGNGLQSAIFQNNPKQLQDLLNGNRNAVHYVDLKWDAEKKSLLHLAVTHGRNKMVRMLMEAGANINGQTEFPYYDTPVHLAIRWGRVSALKLLLNKYDPDIKLECVGRNGDLALKYRPGELAYTLKDRGECAAVIWDRIHNPEKYNNPDYDEDEKEEEVSETF